MKKLLIIWLFSAYAFFSNAQGGVMLEAGGPAGYFSVNYMLPMSTPSGRLEPRIGFGTYRLTGVTGNFRPDIIVPIGFSSTIRWVKRLWIGAGITVSGIQRYEGNELKTDWSVAGFESVSYRFLDKEHFAANVTAYVLNEPQKPFRPWGGLSFTYQF